MDHEKKPVGRPRKFERKRHNQTFRIDEVLREKLQTAADANQRSISEEVERRIDDSFRDHDFLVRLAGSQEVAGLAVAVMTITRIIEAGTGRKYQDDVETNILVAHAIRYLGTRMFPRDRPDAALEPLPVKAAAAVDAFLQVAEAPPANGKAPAEP